MAALYFLATIVLLVVIHEWGHFAVARFFGVGVRSFTVGFGKQFISWVDPKTGTRWGIAPYPVGGYVGLLGEKESAQALNQPEVKGKPFMAAPLHAKLLILVAGPLANLVFAALLYGLLAYSSANPALAILATPPADSAAAQADLRSGDVIYSVNGEPVSSWRHVQTALIQLEVGQTVSLGVQRGAASVTKSLAIPPTNQTRAVDDALGLRLYTQGLKVQVVLPEGAAAKAGVQIGDILQTINGAVIDHPAVLINALQTHSKDAAPLAIEVQRGGQTATAFIKPLLDSAQSYKIGVQFAGLPQLSERSTSLFEALLDGFTTAYTASALTLRAFGQFLLKPFSSEQLAGPITIAKTAQASAQQGWQAALAFVAGLSISVGILNLLPIPLLDGGQIVYHSVNRIATTIGLRFKMASSQRLSQWWTSIGISFVVLLTLLAFFTDFKRLFGF